MLRLCTVQYVAYYALSCVTSDRGPGPPAGPCPAPVAAVVAAAIAPPHYYLLTLRARVWDPPAAFLTQKVQLDEATVKFEIWDTAGQERYRSLAPMYYRGAAAAIVVYDVTNKASVSCSPGEADSYSELERIFGCAAARPFFGAKKRRAVLARSPPEQPCFALI